MQNIAGHMANSVSTTTCFPAEAVPQAPEDPLFGLMRAFRADTSESKIDLVSHGISKLQLQLLRLTNPTQGIGAYRDDKAKPWVLPVVKKV